MVKMKFKEYLNENLTNISFIDELTTFIERQMLVKLTSWIEGTDPK